MASVSAGAHGDPSSPPLVLFRANRNRKVLELTSPRTEHPSLSAAHLLRAWRKLERLLHLVDPAADAPVEDEHQHQRRDPLRRKLKHVGERREPDRAIGAHSANQILDP